MNDIIKNSHIRCENMKLSKNQIISKKIINQSELHKKIEENKYIIDISKKFIDDINNYYSDSKFFGILTDPNGCILMTFGEGEIMEVAKNMKMIPGAYMNEDSIGTNAMSLVISEKKPIQISGDDHYILAYRKWTCSASPIINKSGKMLGIIDITGYKEFMHPHTLGIAISIANSITKIIEKEEANESLALEKKYSETIMDFINSGILTCDLEGNIKSYNRYIKEMFGFSSKELDSFKAWRLFKGWNDMTSSVYNNENYSDKEVFVNTKRNKLMYSLTVYPIYDTLGEVKNIILIFKDIKKIRKLANDIMGRHAIYTFDKIIGKSKKIKDVKKMAMKISDSKSTVLILGESGTGKESFAQSIHNYGVRKNESFVALNCAAIPKNLIETELFGYEEGAFTGAKKSGQPGKFEIADGGTLFLDEIGEMPLDMQSKLLRVIEEGVVCRVGGLKEMVVDVRLIAATNSNLEDDVVNGKFRKDLYYRLNVLPLKLPPLREIKEDIPLFIEHFMKKTSKKLNKNIVEVDFNLMASLKNYSWKGNVRELENFVEHAINAERIPIETLKQTKENKSLNFLNAKLGYSLEEIEKEYIIKTLIEKEYNITSVAKILGIGRNTLYRKMKKYKIDTSI
ncbi:sigma-54 interaction domain-containing protein [Helicovermis profundi]|uniref:Sigma-54-dependent Fis family transcriptional regulator n=1 Tax=Helicovermis profundi TaxID=3065157 RepID=A0AAU9E6V0_9FIRM|nr:sigma-54-dependent Fis family transcriptional regulator [Clostridia bacterium S502]